MPVHIGILDDEEAALACGPLCVARLRAKGIQRPERNRCHELFPLPDMGLDTNCARFLLYCKKLGVDFAWTATIGRQGVNLSGRELKAVLRSFGYDVDMGQIHAILNETDGYAEQLLSFLGAKEVQSFDISEFESATHLHDMNLEVPDRFKGQ